MFDFFKTYATFKYKWRRRGMMQRAISGALIGLGVIDVLTTFYGVSQGYVEENLFLHALSGNPILMITVMAVLKTIAVALSYLLLRRSMIFPALLLIGLFALADLSNLALLM